MKALNLALLGPFKASVNGKRLTRFRTSRAQALLVYLATEYALGAAQQGREILMELLWPGMPPDSARTNLRQNLYYLRQSVPPISRTDGGNNIPFLLSDRQSVMVNGDYPLEFDVQQFSELLDGPQEKWDEAVALYRGDFLTDFYLPDASPFEEWAAARRAALRRQTLNALEVMTDSSIRVGLWREGERYARRQLGIEPLRETAYRQLMKVLYWSGRRAEALKLYLECARILEAELETAPSEATSALAKAIREGNLASRLELSQHGTGSELELSYGRQGTAGTLDEKLEPSGPAEQRGPVKHNLPAAVTPFVGREQELSILGELISDPHVRLITILGPGGIGKTRMALEAAGRQRQSPSLFPDGVFFVSLAPVESVDEIEDTLASVLDLSLQHSGRAAASEREQILAHLARKKMLLVMDNFEHVLEGKTLLAEISKAAPGVKLLVTSRERLQLRGEQIFPVYGLAMPQVEDGAEDATVGYPAAELFLNIARRTVPDFELLAGDAAQVLRICRLVEGMPLGLELAASWTGLLSLGDIAGDIEESMRLLSSEQHDMPERHRSMQAALDVSWKRLTDEQKRAFKQLSIFRGGFTRAAAVAVAGASLPLLAVLLNKSWLTYDRKSDRYHIHELLRQYGISKLKKKAALDQAVRHRHSAYFCRFLKEREIDWFGARQQDAAAEVRNEIENIQSAWRWAASQGDGLLLSEGYKSLGRFYSREMRRRAGKQTFRLAAAELSKVLAKQERDDPQSLILWSQILAWQADFSDELDEKQKLLIQSQDILDCVTAMDRDTRAEQAFIFLQQAFATGKREYNASIRFSMLALELYRELGDRAGEAEALKQLGLGYRRLGKAQQAYDALRGNLDIKQELDDPFGIAEAKAWLGVAAIGQLKTKEGKQLGQQALALFRRLGSRYMEAGVLVNLSYPMLHTGEYLAARELIDQALIFERDFGLPIILWNHYASAHCYLHLGRYAEATATTCYILDIARQRGLSEEIGTGLDLLGAIARARGDLEQAGAIFRESVAVYREAMDVNQFRPLAGLGYVARAQGDVCLARKCLYDVVGATKDYEFTELVLEWLPLAALLAADDGRAERSVELYSLARHIGFVKNSRYWEEVACRELEDVRASLPPEVAAAAEARGRQLDLGKTVDTLIAELSRKPSGEQ